MGVTWKMRFREGNSFSSTIFEEITNSSPRGFASLDSFSLSGLGDCGEATFTAKPSDMPALVPGDTVVIEMQVNDDTSVNVYNGMLVSVGNPNSDDLQTYKAVGFKERFYDIYPTTEVTTIEGDGKNVAEDLINVLSSYRGLPNIATSINSPAAGQNIDPIAIDGKSLGELLDEAASLAGPFVVQSGNTFTYNGVTFEAGEIVPGCQWGVRANPTTDIAEVFFERPVETLTLTEGASQTRTIYPEINDEEFVNKVVVRYITSLEFSDTFNLRTDSPDGERYKTTSSFLSFDFSNGDERGRERIITIDDPLPFLVEQASLDSTLGTVSNPNNAFDGDDSTYASINFGSIETNDLTFNERVGAVFRLRARLISTTEEPLLVIFYMSNARFVWETNVFDETFEALFYIPQTYEPGDPIDKTLTAEVLTLGEARVYAMEWFAPDLSQNDAFERFARSFVTEPRRSAAQHVVLPETQPDLAPLAVFNKADGTSETLSVERINHRVTTEDGYVVEYDLGQGFEAEALSEKSVIQGIARSVVRG